MSNVGRKMASGAVSLLKGTAALVVGSTAASCVMAYKPTGELKYDTMLSIGAGGVASTITYEGIGYIQDEITGNHPKKYRVDTGKAKQILSGKGEKKKK